MHDKEKEMKIDNKRILKEFLRLKWHETKYIWMVVLPFMYVWLWIMNPLFLEIADEDDHIFVIYITSFIMVLALSGIAFLLVIAFKGFINWIKNNWDQAKRNVQYKLSEDLKSKKRKKK